MKKTALFVLSAILLCLLPSCAQPENGEVQFSHYDITATYDEETRTLHATQKVEFVNTYDVPLSDLVFRLYGNAFLTNEAVSASVRDKAYYKGDSVGSITIDSVTVDGTEAVPAFTDSRHSVRVDLNGEVFPDERVKVEMTFTLRLAEVISRLGVTPSSVILSHWHPVLAVLEDGEWVADDFTAIGDPFFSECATYSVKLSVPQGYVAATGAKLLSQRAQGGMVTREYSASRVRDFSVVLSRQFKTVSALSGSAMVTYYYLTDTAPEAALRTAQSALATFSEYFGAYPYPTFVLVESPLLYGGMEYSAMAVVDDSIKDKTQVIAHEVAHQWWGQITGNNQISHAFIDEGLAEWSTTQYYASIGEMDVVKMLREDHEKRYVLYLDVTAKMTGQVDTVMKKRLSQFVSEYEYEIIAYSKGYLMFDSLAELIGKDAMIAGLKTYFQENMFKTASQNDLMAAIERGSSRRTEGIFSAWIDGRVTYYLLGKLN